ncbi:MAG: hypothetical protein ACPIOQ_16705, partial [Promethearchaeia archaeon]
MFQDVCFLPLSLPFCPGATLCALFLTRLALPFDLQRRRANAMSMKAFLVAVLLSHGAVEALADGGLVLSIGQMLSCLPVSAALCLPLCWTQQVETGRECLVERYGRYHRRLTPGWHLVCSPFET